MPQKSSDSDVAKLLKFAVPVYTLSLIYFSAIVLGVTGLVVGFKLLL